MATYIMSATGNDTTGTGSLANPYKTLNKCCTVAGSDDTIYIRDAGGVYFISSEHSFKPVGTSGHTLTITNYSGESPIFDGTGGSFSSTDAILAVSAGSKYADIGGFTVRNCAQGNAKGRGLEISSSTSPSKCTDLVFRDLTIHNVWTRAFGGAGDNITFRDFEVYDAVKENVGQALGGGGWAAAVSSYTYSNGTLPLNWNYLNGFIHEVWGEGLIALRVTGCTIDNVTIRNAFSKTLYLDKCADVIVKNSHFIFSDATYQRSGHNSDGITFAVEGTPLHPDFGVDDVQIYNNIIAGARDGFTWFTDSNETESTYRDIRFWHNSMYALERYGMRIEANGASATNPTGCEARNNIFDGTMVTLSDPAAWTFSNNRWDSIPGVDTHTNSITSDPGYVNPTLAYDNEAGFQVTSSSAMIGAGIAVAEVTTDRDGNARSGSAPTIGAYEYGTTTEPPPATSTNYPKRRGIGGRFSG